MIDIGLLVQFVSVAQQMKIKPRLAPSLPRSRMSQEFPDQRFQHGLRLGQQSRHPLKQGVARHLGEQVGEDRCLASLPPIERPRRDLGGGRPGHIEGLSQIRVEEPGIG
jgi:hypothetical protein